MSNSFFFLQAEKNQRNADFIEALEQYSQTCKQQLYVIDRPLGDEKYAYQSYPSKLIFLAPGYQITLVNFEPASNAFEEFAADFVEDLASLSDKFQYKNVLGRSRHWRETLIAKVQYEEKSFTVETFLDKIRLEDGRSKKHSELLISLLTGSINDIDLVKGDLPDNALDKIKQKIILFDGDQTRFIYQAKGTQRISIQGLSGTGKTELLLHKLRELYTQNKDARILFTCHNKILADSLRNRIPDFFNFMKVEEQIKWHQRLWCVSAWGSEWQKDSGAYAYICKFYQIPFLRYSQATGFDYVCKKAIQDLANLDMQSVGFAFDYALIDESQDFPDAFLELCGRVTRHTVYVAGDIFQSIFGDANVSEIRPDYLLSKCYRTDPRTLMFAHAVGMGLFETPKLRWLEDREWTACGYMFEKNGSEYVLRREPLRRFEDLQEEGVRSVDIVKTSKDKEEDAEKKILEIIAGIVEKYPTVLPDDIGIIFIDNNKNTYLSADRLEQSIPHSFGWLVNKAYESKEKVPGKVFLSNRNNVKGLEFPFVICVTKMIHHSRNYRNALYMMLTRSFLKTFLLTSQDSNGDLIAQLETGLEIINTQGLLKVDAPSEAERMLIRTTISYDDRNVSFYDFVYDIFDELEVPVEVRDRLFNSVTALLGNDFDYEKVREVIEFNIEHLKD